MTIHVEKVLVYAKYDIHQIFSWKKRISVKNNTQSASNLSLMFSKEKEP